MTWLGMLNFVVLQWFFLRLARVREPAGAVVGYTWLVGVVPLTGWWSDYRWIGDR